MKVPYLAADFGRPDVQGVVCGQQLALVQYSNSLFLSLLHQLYVSQSVQDLKFKSHVFNLPLGTLKFLIFQDVSHLFEIHFARRIIPFLKVDFSETNTYRDVLSIEARQMMFLLLDILQSPHPHQLCLQVQIIVIPPCIFKDPRTFHQSFQRYRKHFSLFIGYNLYEELEDIPFAMIVDEGPPEKIQNLCIIGMPQSNMFDSFKQRWKVVGLQFQSIDKISKSCAVISILIVNHPQQIVNRICTKVDLQIFLANILSFFYTF